MPITTAKDFGEIIRALRKKARLTQAELAATSGVGERFVRELEKGKKSCQLEKALMVAFKVGIQLKAKLPSGFFES